jgi:hypothetical protein
MGWVVSATPRPLHPRERPGTHTEAGLAPGPVWTGAQNLAPTGIWSPDRPARSESLYRLRCPGPISRRTVTLIWSQLMLVPYLEIIRNINFLNDFPSYKYCLRDEELRKKTHYTPRHRENACIPTFKCKSLLAHAHTPYTSNKHVTDTYAGMNGVRCGQQGLDVG